MNKFSIRILNKFSGYPIMIYKNGKIPNICYIFYIS